MHVHFSIIPVGIFLVAKLQSKQNKANMLFQYVMCASNYTRCFIGSLFYVHANLAKTSRDFQLHTKK